MVSWETYQSSGYSRIDSRSDTDSPSSWPTNGILRQPEDGGDCTPSCGSDFRSPRRVMSSRKRDTSTWCRVLSRAPMELGRGRRTKLTLRTTPEILLKLLPLLVASVFTWDGDARPEDEL